MCAELINILASVVREMVKELIISDATHFICLTGDGTEARKTCEEKELVYAKFLAQGEKGHAPIACHLQCYQMRDFGGPMADATFKVMKDALISYIPSEEMAKAMLVIACADGASVNFGEHTGSLTQLKEWSGNEPLLMHCLSHRLELAIKDAFELDSSFKDLKSELDDLYQLFKNSGKCWRVLQLVGYELGAIVLRFTRSNRTRFQDHTIGALGNFLWNYLACCVLAENAIANNGLLTAEMQARMRGYLNTWLSYEHLIRTQFYKVVLKQTSLISLKSQSNITLIYEMRKTIQQANENLTETKEENVILPFQSNDITHKDDDNIRISVSADNLPQKKKQKLSDEAGKMSERQKNKSRKYVSTVTKEFEVRNIRKGRQVEKKVKENVLPIIENNISFRFADLLEDRIFKSFTVFDTSLWSTTEDTTRGLDRDYQFLDVIQGTFRNQLNSAGYDHTLAKREWKKTKRVIAESYLHLAKDSPCLIWSRYIDNCKLITPKVCMLLEILVIFLFSSTAVERGISTLNRNVTSQHTYQYE